jgi:hypothetical protein
LGGKLEIYESFVSAFSHKNRYYRNAMRNRTEMVSNTGSDFDEGEFDADEGSDDWKPDPEVSGVFFESACETAL